MFEILEKNVFPCFFLNINKHGKEQFPVLRGEHEDGPGRGAVFFWDLIFLRNVEHFTVK
jgi:hypothetical protein